MAYPQSRDRSWHMSSILSNVCEIPMVAVQLLKKIYITYNFSSIHQASIAQLGERKTEDLKVTGSIPVRSMFFIYDYGILLF
jgi:hypothetical protein